MSVFVANRFELWEFTVETDQLGGSGSLNFEPVAQPGIPFRLWVQGPGNIYEQLTLPDAVSFAITESVVSFFFILEVDDQVSTQLKSWGGIKSLFQ